MFIALDSVRHHKLDIGMAVCLQCGTRLNAGEARCVVCGHPRLGVLPAAIPQRQVLFGGTSVLVVYALTVLSQIPVMLILYLVPSRQSDTRHCADTIIEACGFAGAAVEVAFWIVPYLVMLAGAILLAQRLTEPSLIGPGLMATAGLLMPWLYALGHVFGAFPAR